MTEIYFYVLQKFSKETNNNTSLIYKKQKMEPSLNIFELLKCPCIKNASNTLP